jgi:hypothetical protein
MEEKFELRLEVPVIAPDTPESLGSYVRQAILEAEKEAGLPEQLPTFAQELPTVEEVTVILKLIVAVLSLVKVSIELWPKVRKFLRDLADRLEKKLPAKINAEVCIGEKKVRVEGLTPKDAITVIIDEYEVYFRPREQE